MPQKRGPKTAWSDAALLKAIHGVLATCPFYGEGYRKVRARLAHCGIHVSRKRVLRLMRAHGLLAPRRLGPPHGNPAHDGQIITDCPDVMLGHGCYTLLHGAGRLVLVLWRRRSSYR